MIDFIQSYKNIQKYIYIYGINMTLTLKILLKKVFITYAGCIHKVSCRIHRKRVEQLM